MIRWEIDDLLASLIEDAANAQERKKFVAAVYSWLEKEGCEELDDLKAEISNRDEEIIKLKDRMREVDR